MRSEWQGTKYLETISKLVLLRAAVNEFINTWPKNIGDFWYSGCYQYPLELIEFTELREL
jgi:hypothetical protein